MRRESLRGRGALVKAGRWAAGLLLAAALGLSPSCTTEQLADARTAADTIGVGLAAMRALLETLEASHAKCECPPIEARP